MYNYKDGRTYYYGWDDDNRFRYFVTYKNGRYCYQGKDFEPYTVKATDEETGYLLGAVAKPVNRLILIKYGFK